MRRLITSGNVWLLKLSRVRWGNEFLGVPVLLLTTIGRKSGQPRTRPLYYLETEDGRYVLVASNAGTSKDPAWLLNLQANPHVTIEVQGKKKPMIAHVATPEEKEVLWPQMLALFPTWEMMQERSPRPFKLVILEPAADAGAADAEASPDEEAVATTTQSS
jgi:deazaflavin-dependent oxidoreductase (nitroreductase family)